jgi:hypothetical protein
VASRSSSGPGLDADERRCAEDVERYGLHLIHVAPNGDLPGWSYSIGLPDTLQHPELIVFGLPRDTAHAMLNTAADEIRAGRPFSDGAETDALLDGYSCLARTVMPIWYEPLVGWARWYHRSDGFQLLQLLWPDRQHRYPWDPDVIAEVRQRQPRLFEPDPDVSGMRPTSDSLGR